MATATTLVLKNAAAVNVNYYPIKIVTGDVAQYVDRTNGALNAQARASLFFRESISTRKVSGKLTYPVVDAVTGLVKYTNLATFEIVTPLAATLVERQEILARAKAMIADAIVTAAVENGETPW